MEPVTDAILQVVNMAAGIQSQFSFQRVEEVAIAVVISAGRNIAKTTVLQQALN